MFEKAVRMKLRWKFKGLASAEDLWDLRVEDLDDIFKHLRQAKAQEEESLLVQTTKNNEVLDLRIEIIKYVVRVKLAEAASREDEAITAARKQKLLGLLEKKQDAELLDRSAEELQALIDAL